MYLRYILIVLAASASAQQRKCDQTPPQAKTAEPITDSTRFQLKIGNAKDNMFIALQTYVLTLETTEIDKNFTWFMITAEDPDVDNKIYTFGRKTVDVGSLKTLDPSKSRYSEKCANTVESFDNTPKNKVEVHWVSPSESESVRIRAMVAENPEAWYTGSNLTIILLRDLSPPKDDPPLQAMKTCPLCSEARYEVIFKGHWSRLEHPLHYPSKPDENGYSFMIGASHDYNYTIWQLGVKANAGMTALARDSDITILERDIINSMSETGGTRTLIKGKRRHHPDMHKWSHALFRVDRIHHLFTIVVSMRPSPDWFLGTKKFELCTKNGWYEQYTLPMYPWDAGVMDGVSYESPTSVTNPEGIIERVEVGSFNEASPFFQTNLNELKPFAYLEVRRLDVYPLDPRECSGEGGEDGYETLDQEEEVSEEPQDEPQSDPVLAESRQYTGCLGEWGEWSPCVPDVGWCGIGAQTRTWVRGLNNRYDDRVVYKKKALAGLCSAVGDNELWMMMMNSKTATTWHRWISSKEDDIEVLPSDDSCQADGDPHPMEIKDCIIDC